MEFKPSYVDSLQADIRLGYTNFLMHYGVLGMHWGIRRYQNSDGSLTPAGKNRYSLRNGKTNLESLKNTGIKAKNILTSDKAKKAMAVGAAVAGTALLTYGGYQLARNADLTKDPNFDKSTGFMKQSGPHDHMDDYNKANPLLMIPGNDYKHNCPFASMAYEMRRRGFDVRAGKAHNGHGMTPAEIDKMYKNAETHNIEPTYERKSTIFDLLFSSSKSVINTPEFKEAQNKRVDAIFNQCAQFGPNARGNIEVYWAQGGGHIFSFENDSKGRVNFMDAQIAQTGKQHRFVANAIDKFAGKGFSKRAAKKGSIPDFRTSTHGGYNSSYADVLRQSIDPSKQCRVRRTDNAEIDFNFLHKNDVVRNPSVVKRTFGIGV